MITGDIKNQIDRIWNAFWSGGISNPLEVIEQITYLLFMCDHTCLLFVSVGSKCKESLGFECSMARQNTKLELTCIGKENRPRLEPRILIEDPEKSYHAPHRVSEHDIFDNRLIFGDNLLALKALEQEYTGKVKCIFIDPPYNTGSAFTHYDDGVEHSLWLSLMRDRLELIRVLLSEDGSLWITIDDNEAHYLKVLCDEVFGRPAFVTTVVWENFYGRSNAAAISPGHNYVLVYSPMGLDWKRVRNLLPRDEKAASKYTNPDNDVRGPWRLGPIFAAEERHEGLMYSITTPSGRIVKPPKG